MRRMQPARASREIFSGPKGLPNISAEARERERRRAAGEFVKNSLNASFMRERACPYVRVRMRAGADGEGAVFLLMRSLVRYAAVDWRGVRSLGRKFP